MLKNTIVLFGISFLYLSCNIKTSSEQRDGFQAKDTSNQIPSEIIINSSKVSDTLVKFNPKVTFRKFKASTLINQVKAPINWSSNKSAKKFKARIEESYRNLSPNFAGHYTFFDWGCGSSCQSSMLIDWNTGNLYDGISATLGYEYTLDSRMLIVNPPDSTDYNKNCVYCEPHIYIFNERLKHFEEYQIKK